MQEQSRSPSGPGASPARRPEARSPRQAPEGGADHLRSVRAAEVAPGDRFLTRQGDPSAPVTAVRTTRDDFGTPALVIATLQDGREVRIAYASSIRVRTTRPAAALDPATAFAPVQEGSPEATVVALAKRHPQDQHALGLAAKLSRGINLRSGSQLEDIDTLARYLFTELDDADSALEATKLLTELPYDGAMGRWKSIESSLALAANIHFHRGEDERGEALGERLREPDEDEPDPLRRKVAGEVRQRQLDEPNLYDREIERAQAADDDRAERSWRSARLSTLFFLRARGGSRTLTDAELDRRINLEVTALREVAGRLAEG